MSHGCPAPDCRQDGPVPDHLFACRRDWYRLPKSLRDRVWDTAGWPFGDERAAVVADCVEYWRTHPAGRASRPTGS